MNPILSHARPYLSESTLPASLVETRILDALGRIEKQLAAPESPYLTAKEAAAYLNISYGSFRNHATEITRYRTGRYRREDLDKWAAGRKKK